MGKTYIDSTNQPVLIIGSSFMSVAHRDERGNRKVYTGKVFFGVRRTVAGMSQSVMYTQGGRLLCLNPGEAKGRLVSKVTHVWDNSDGLEASK